MAFRAGFGRLWDWLLVKLQMPKVSCNSFLSLYVWREQQILSERSELEVKRTKKGFQRHGRKVTCGVAQPENSLSSFCVIGNNDQILMSIIKDDAPLRFSGLLRALVCAVFYMEVGGQKCWAQ